MSRRQHWETVYKTKSPMDVGWTQEIPKPSLMMIKELDLPKSASIIDIGGGDSKLVEFLLDEGYTDLTVLDISAPAIERARQRLGENAGKIQWIVSDILNFKPERTYDLWHDRAAFHFLTKQDQINTYTVLAKTYVLNYITIGTFSVDGPKKCSGLFIRQYDESMLEKEFGRNFKMISSFREDHITPSGNPQNFVFAAFRRDG